jgi:hypothetical protein
MEKPHDMILQGVVTSISRVYRVSDDKLKESDDKPDKPLDEWHLEEDED